MKTLKIIFLSTSWFERKVVLEFTDGSQNIQFQYLNLAQVIPCSPQINRAWLYFFDFEKQVNKWLNYPHGDLTLFYYVCLPCADCSFPSSLFHTSQNSLSFSVIVLGLQKSSSVTVKLAIAPLCVCVDTIWCPHKHWWLSGNSRSFSLPASPQVLPEWRAGIRRFRVSTKMPRSRQRWRRPRATIKRRQQRLHLCSPALCAGWVSTVALFFVLFVFFHGEQQQFPELFMKPSRVLRSGRS